MIRRAGLAYKVADADVVDGATVGGGRGGIEKGTGLVDGSFKDGAQVPVVTWWRAHSVCLVETGRRGGREKKT